MKTDNQRLQELADKTSKLNSDELLTLYISLIASAATESQTASLKKIFKTLIVRALTREGFR